MLNTSQEYLYTRANFERSKKDSLSLGIPLKPVKKASPYPHKEHMTSFRQPTACEGEKAQHRGCSRCNSLRLRSRHSHQEHGASAPKAVSHSSARADGQRAARSPPLTRTKRSVTRALYLRLTRTSAPCERGRAARCRGNGNPPCPSPAPHSQRFPGPLGRHTAARHAALRSEPRPPPRRPHRAPQSRARRTQWGPIPPATVRLYSPLTPRSPGHARSR